MQLQSHIVIHRTPEEVWKFLGDPANVSQWDRGVAAVEETSAVPHGVGFEFDTLAPTNLNLPAQGRMSYRIKDTDPTGRCVVELTSKTGNARYFRSCEWRFDTQAILSGTLLTCSAAVSIRWKYLWLAPLLYLKKSAILMDLEFLKTAIESQPNESQPD